MNNDVTIKTHPTNAIKGIGLSLSIRDPQPFNNVGFASLISVTLKENQRYHKLDKKLFRLESYGNRADERLESPGCAVMNELDVGVDIVEIARFRRSDYFRTRRFYERTFTLREIEHCLSFDDPAPHFAANFAAKEAVYKAVNRFRDIKLSWIEILRDKTGAPYVNILLNRKEAGRCKSCRKNLPFEIKVSLSHSASNAVAFAVAIYSGRAIRNFSLHIENSVLT